MTFFEIGDILERLLRFDFSNIIGQERPRGFYR